MASPLGRLISDQVLAAMARQYDPAKEPDLDALIRWEVSGSGDGADVHELVISEGRCRHRRGAGEAKPTTTLRLDRAALLDLALGSTNGPRAYLDGRVDIRGDLHLAARMGELFPLPR